MTKNKVGMIGLIALSLASASGCATASTPKPAAPQSGNEWMVSGVGYYRSAAENRALYYQAWNAARTELDRDLHSKHKGKPAKRAIIVDCDETVLDNSEFEAGLIKTRKVYPEGWAEWIEAAKAKATPGSVEFLKYADSKGVDIFYVTNRMAGKESEATARNLQSLGFPQSEKVVGKTDSSSKESRRRKIAEDHRIVLLAGDTLADLAEAWDKKTIEERAANVDRLRAEFGHRFISLPNSMYGDWEAAMYRYNFKSTPAEKAKMRVDAATANY